MTPLNFKHPETHQEISLLEYPEETTKSSVKVRDIPDILVIFWENYKFSKLYINNAESFFGSTVLGVQYGIENLVDECREFQEIAWGLQKFRITFDPHSIEEFKDVKLPLSEDQKQKLLKEAELLFLHELGDVFWLIAACAEDLPLLKLMLEKLHYSQHYQAKGVDYFQQKEKELMNEAAIRFYEAVLKVAEDNPEILDNPLGFLGIASRISGNSSKIIRDGHKGFDHCKTLIDRIYYDLGCLFWKWIRTCNEYHLKPITVIQENHFKLLNRFGYKPKDEVA